MFEDYEVVKAGEKEKTKITEVIEGTQGDFKSEKYFEKIEGTPEEIANFRSSPAIKVVTENGANLVIGLPKEKKIFPNSNLALFKETYRDFPKVDMEVTTKTDDNGFKKIVLEK